MSNAMTTLIEARLSLSVNYEFSVKDAIQAGHYDWVDPDIMTENNTPARNGRPSLQVVLVHFAQHMSHRDTLDQLEEQGLRPAGLPELMAFGATYPDAQRQFPIVAIGTLFCPLDSRLCRQRHSACLFVAGQKRFLELDSWGHGWARDYRFLAVARP